MKTKLEINLDLDNRKAFLIKRYYKKGKILNVGSGGLYIEGAVNVDINPKYRPDIIADFHHLPFKDNSFDVVLALDIIEHTESPEILLNELLRVSKEDGCIIIECLDFDICKQNWINDPTHKTYFNYYIFKNFLSPKGFKVFYLYGGMMVGIKNPKIGDKYLCYLYAVLRNQLRRLHKFNNKIRSILNKL